MVQKKYVLIPAHPLSDGINYSISTDVNAFNWIRHGHFHLIRTQVTSQTNYTHVQVKQMFRDGQ